MSEPGRRLALVWRMEVAGHTRDRRRADWLMVKATRWLKEHPQDAVVSEAPLSSWRAFPPDLEEHGALKGYPESFRSRCALLDGPFGVPKHNGTGTVACSMKRTLIDTGDGSMPRGKRSPTLI